MNVYAKQKQTCRYRKQTIYIVYKLHNGNQRGEGKGEGKIRGMGLRTTMYKIDKQQGYTL